MEHQGIATSPRPAGALLAASFFVFLVGGLLFWARNGMDDQPAPSFAYLALERGSIMAAAVVTAIGLLLLAPLVGGARADTLLPARLVAATYAAATALLLVAELNLLRGGRFPYPLVVAYVVPAFLAQAALGAILLRAGFLPAWLGRTAIGWNLGWLVALALLTPGNIYFPVLHHTIPLVIGIALLRRG